MVPTQRYRGADLRRGCSSNPTSLIGQAAEEPAVLRRRGQFWDLTVPEKTSSGVFGGQLVAATLNVAVDDSGLRRDGASQPCSAGTLGTLLYVAGCVDDDLVGLSVNQLIALANTAISGGGTPAGVTIGDLSDALAVLNENFVDCDTNLGCLTLLGPCP